MYVRLDTAPIANPPMNSTTIIAVPTIVNNVIISPLMSANLLVQLDSTIMGKGFVILALQSLLLARNVLIKILVMYVLMATLQRKTSSIKHTVISVQLIVIIALLQLIVQIARTTIMLMVLINVSSVLLIVLTV